MLDMLDGRIARASGRQSAAGALYDSVADRWAEAFVFTGLAWYLRASPWMLASLGAGFASMMVSYTRARGEGLGLSLRGGVMQRAERIILVAVGMLIDQDTRVKSRFVNFFGMPASTPVGAALMAMKTGATVVPALIHLGKDNLQHMVLYPEVEMVNTGDEEQDMITNTQTLTTILEEAIRRNPAQWVWMHERWKTKPGEEER